MRPGLEAQCCAVAQESVSQPRPEAGLEGPKQKPGHELGLMVVRDMPQLYHWVRGDMIVRTGQQQWLRVRSTQTPSGVSLTAFHSCFEHHCTGSRTPHGKRRGHLLTRVLSPYSSGRWRRLPGPLGPKQKYPRGRDSLAPLKSGTHFKLIIQGWGRVPLDQHDLGSCFSEQGSFLGMLACRGQGSEEMV